MLWELKKNRIKCISKLVIFLYNWYVLICNIFVQSISLFILIYSKNAIFFYFSQILITSQFNFCNAKMHNAFRRLTLIYKLKRKPKKKGFLHALLRDRWVYEGFTSMYATIALEGGGGKRKGYAGRGRVMHIDAGLHEFFILSYDFESRSFAHKSISPPPAHLSRE